jgi:uncharacterized protein YcbX
MSTTAIASTVSLWRYPVKSMMGEELNACEVTERGLLGDRVYALLDAATGKVASAKHPRKWARLFDCRAAFAEPPQANRALPPVRITLPDGALVTSDEPDADRRLSDVLGRAVQLKSPAPKTPSLEEYWPDMDGLAHRETVTDEPMPLETFFDLAVVHLLTTSTMDRLRDLYPQGRFEVRRFRPNIVVTPLARNGFVENSWVGRTLAIGEEVRLSVTGPCPRCVMTTLAQGDLPADPGILRAAARHNDVSVGVYAAVLRGGRIQRGDPVRLE